MPHLPRLLPWVAALLLAGSGCASRAAGSGDAHVATVTAATAPNANGGALETNPSAPGRSNDGAGGPLPIYPEDARWGSDLARITIVAVLDLECPYCERAERTLEQLHDHYGPGTVRIVLKHYPLPFHPHARAAALAAMGVQRAAGDAAVFRFVNTVYAHQSELDGAKLAEWAGDAVRSGAAHAATPTTSSASPTLSLDEQLRRDRDFADRAGVDGTPCFFVNGAMLTGAQPYEQFTAAIDAELLAIEQARRDGKAVAYADRTLANFAAPAKRDTADDPDEDTTVWKIPVGTSPVLGPPDALVTIVEFADYECPYCKRVQPTLDALRARYPNDVRIVFKHDPLPFHAHARPAAELALEAYREKGAAVFWAASKALFDAAAEDMAEDDLLRIGAVLGLDAPKVRAAVQKGAHDGDIEDDLELGLDFAVRGAPHFFVNGRRLVGAQPLERFAALVEEQLAFATALAQKGIPRSRVYETIRDHAEEPPPPAVADLGVPPANRASLGPASAAVVVREFSDFECPFCARVEPTLIALRKEFPRDVRLVWHDLPLPFHAHARAAANAALEARARGGDTAFWKIHDLIFQHQSELSTDTLADLGKSIGVSPAAIRAAIEEGRYDAALDEDGALAEKAGIHGTPGFVINGYVVSGAQPLTEFRRTVRRALADRARAVSAVPARAPSQPAH